MRGDVILTMLVWAETTVAATARMVAKTDFIFFSNQLIKQKKEKKEKQHLFAIYTKQQRPDGNCIIIISLLGGGWYY